MCVFDQSLIPHTLKLALFLSPSLFLLSHPWWQVFLIGLMQTLFEGSMHVFIFMWTPVLQTVPAPVRTHTCVYTSAHLVQTSCAESVA